MSPNSSFLLKLYLSPSCHEEQWYVGLYDMLSSIIDDKLAKEHLILLPEASLKLALHSFDLPLDVFSVRHCRKRQTPVLAAV